jgi:hypothetical protein
LEIVTGGGNKGWGERCCRFYGEDYIDKCHVGKREFFLSLEHHVINA